MKDQESVRTGGDAAARSPGASQELVPLGEASSAGLVGLPRHAAPAAAHAEAAAAALSPLDLLKAMRRRPWVAFGLGPLGAVLVAAAAWFLMPAPQYSATAILHVDSVQPRLVLRTAEANVDLTTFQRTQTTLIRSRPVLNEALKRRDSQRQPINQLPVMLQVAEREDPAEWLARELQVDFVGEIIRITLSNDDPQVAATLVNAVTDAYIEEIVQADDDARRDRLKRLEGLYDEYQETLKFSRQKLRGLAESLGSNDEVAVSKVQQMALGRQEDLEKELRQYQAELRRLTAEAQILRARKQARRPPAVSEAVVTEAVRRDPEVARLTEEVAAKGRALARVGQVYRTPQADPEVQALGREAEALRRTLAERVAALRPQVVAALQAAGRDPDAAELEELEQRIAVLTHLQDGLAEQVQAQATSVKKLGTEALEAETIKDEILHQDNAAKQIGAEIENLRVELKADPRVRLTQHAEAPRLRPEGARIKRAGGAAVATLALILLGLTLAEYRARRVDSVADISRGLGLSIVGTLPIVTARVRRRPIETGAARGLAARTILIESVDATRAMVLHAARTEGLRVLMVTSAVDGEGKTSTAAHLAASLARAGHRTALIDCDLRRPAAHRLFERDVTPGVCEVLREEIAADAALRPTAQGGLWILPAGRCDDAALAALARAAIRPILDQLREGFEFVIVDSSPVLPVADAIQVAQDVDAVILSVLRDVSRLPQVQATYHRLAGLGVRILGAVAIGMHNGSYYYSSYHY